MVRYQIAFLWLAIGLCSAQTRQVAITFDDLPRGGDSPGPRNLGATRAMTVKLLGPLKGVPVTAFVNAGQERDFGAAGVQDVLRLWVKQGIELGNHTYSHPDLNRVSVDEYTRDLMRGEPAIVSAQGRKPLYFRHPFLHAGKDAASKDGLNEFLSKNGYRVAPVTIDNSDWLFAAAYAHGLAKEPAVAKRVREAYIPYMESIFEFFETRSKEVFGREVPQVLLLHANQLNADTMGEMLQMIRSRGYKIVSLTDALRDPVYAERETYVGPGGFSWIHRWSMTKGLKNRGEPEPEPWVEKELQRLK